MDKDTIKRLSEIIERTQNVDHKLNLTNRVMQLLKDKCYFGVYLYEYRACIKGSTNCPTLPCLDQAPFAILWILAPQSRKDIKPWSEFKGGLP